MCFFDEARPAINAIEMSESGDFLVAKYNGAADMWYTKPPLSIWCQVLFIKLLGPTELAARLPSAFAALGLVLLLLWFAKKNGAIWWGYFSAMILLTTSGFIGEHVARTADPDTLLCLFTTAYMLLFYQYTESKETKYLFYCGIAIAWAGLTKGVAGFLLLPGILLYAIYYRHLGGMLKKPSTYGAVAVAVLPVLLFYYLREQYNPGYIEAVFENELGGRFSEVIEGHQHPFNYYFKFIWKSHFTFWLAYIPLAIWLAIKSEPAQRRLQFLIFSTVIIYLLLVSSAQTKVFWYTAPVFPLLALSIGYALWELCKKLTDVFIDLYPQRSTRFVFPALFVLALFFFPYKSIVEKIYHPKVIYAENTYGPYLKKKHPLAKQIIIPSVGKYNPSVGKYNPSVGKYNGHIDYYCKALKSKGFNISQKYSHELHVNDTLLICEQPNYDDVSRIFILDVLERQNSCTLFLVVDKREEFK